MPKIQRVRIAPNGEVAEVQLDDGRRLNLPRAVEEARQGALEGVAVIHNSIGVPTIRAVEGPSLDQLPRF